MEALGGIANDEATGMQRVEVTKMGDPWVVVSTPGVKWTRYRSFIVKMWT